MYIRFISVFILYIELILFFLYFNIYIDYTYEKIQRTCNYELLVLTYHVIFVSLSIKIDFYWNVIYNHNLSNIHTQNIHLARKITFALFKNQYSNDLHLILNVIWRQRDPPLETHSNKTVLCLSNIHVQF